MAKLKLSCSRMGLRAKCAEAERRRYILGEKIPPAIALIVGSGAHESADCNLQHKLDSGEPVEREEAETVGRDYVSAQFESGDYLLRPDERAEKAVDAWRDEAVDSVVVLSGLHHEFLAPNIIPTAVQRRWELEVAGFPMDLTGVIDVQELKAIRDFKTTGKTAKQIQTDADQSDQLSLYGVAVQALDGAAPEQYALDAARKLKKKTEAFTVTTRRGPEQFQEVLDVVAVTMDGIEKGTFEPWGRGTWFCDRKWCGYYETCKYRKGYRAFLMGKE